MTAAAQRVVVLHGAVPPEAPPDEQDTLVEVRAVCAALERLGYAAEPLGLTLELSEAAEALCRRPPTFLFNLVQSLGGQGEGIVQAVGFLEALGLPYTGAPGPGLLLSSDKRAAKERLARQRIPTPPWTFPGGPPAAWDGAWIVKSVWEHASIGLDDAALVARAADLPPVLAERRARLRGQWFAEAFVEGREFNVALLEGAGGPEVLPIAEIRFIDFPAGKPRIVGYRAKWEPDSFEYRHTVRVFPDAPEDGPLLGELGVLACRCWAAFRLRGYARVDFRVDAAGRPWVLEVNANPCLAPDAGFVAAAERAGLSFDALVRRIVAALTTPGRAARAGADDALARMG
jgi:D-alanine-D-alanine ligase